MNYRIRFHPLVSRDLDAIAHWILDFAGPDVAARKLAEIEAAIATLTETPHKGSLQDEIAPGLRAIPAGRKAVIVRIPRKMGIDSMASRAAIPREDGRLI